MFVHLALVDFLFDRTHAQKSINDNFASLTKPPRSLSSLHKD